MEFLNKSDDVLRWDALTQETARISDESFEQKWKSGVSYSNDMDAILSCFTETDAHANNNATSSLFLGDNFSLADLSSADESITPAHTRVGATATTPVSMCSDTCVYLDRALRGGEDMDTDSHDSAFLSSVATTPKTRDSHGLREDFFNVLTDDKKYAISIPPELVEQTVGSQKYMMQDSKTALEFQFHLCRSYRPGVKCPHKRRCAFIHSLHQLEPTQENLSKVRIIPVHHRTAVPSLMESLYARHEAGITLHVMDSVNNVTRVIDSGNVYVTESTDQRIRLYKSNAKQVGTKRRLQFCTHFNRGMCCRGPTCHFVHFIPVNGASLEILAPAVLSGSEAVSQSPFTTAFNSTAAAGSKTATAHPATSRQLTPALVLPGSTGCMLPQMDASKALQFPSQNQLQQQQQQQQQFLTFAYVGGQLVPVVSANQLSPTQTQQLSQIVADHLLNQQQNPMSAGQQVQGNISPLSQQQRLQMSQPNVAGQNQQPNVVFLQSPFHMQQSQAQNPAQQQQQQNAPMMTSGYNQPMMMSIPQQQQHQQQQQQLQLQAPLMQQHQHQHITQYLLQQQQQNNQQQQQQQQWNPMALNNGGMLLR